MISLISKSKNLTNPDRIEVRKETQFWVRFHALLEKNIYVPSVKDLGAYLLNYIPGIHKMSPFNSILVDGTPNYMYEWPVFRKTEHTILSLAICAAKIDSKLQVHCHHEKPCRYVCYIQLFGISAST